MNSAVFDSHSQNGEDVVLWRALGNVPGGRYVDVGANHPVNDSVTMAFYERGWSGITVEPDPQFAALLREHRPRDIQVEAAATSRDGEPVTLHVVDGTGLSTLDDSLARSHGRAGRPTHDVTVPSRRLDSILDEAGWAGGDIHFVSIDTEGSEPEVLAGIDLSVWRPWVMVIEATAPNSPRSTSHVWEHVVTGAGYRCFLFDGLSCFYVAEEHAERLGPALSYPACVLDNYTTQAEREYRSRAEVVPQLVREVSRWRGKATAEWAAAVAAEASRREEVESLGAVVQSLREHIASLQEERDRVSRMHELSASEAREIRRQFDDLRSSTSWRVTGPLRTASGLLARARTAR